MYGTVHTPTLQHQNHSHTEIHRTVRVRTIRGKVVDPDLNTALAVPYALLIDLVHCKNKDFSCSTHTTKPVWAIPAAP